MEKLTKVHQTTRGQFAVSREQPTGGVTTMVRSKGPLDHEVEWRRGCLVSWKNLHPSWGAPSDTLFVVGGLSIRTILLIKVICG